MYWKVSAGADDYITKPFSMEELVPAGGYHPSRKRRQEQQCIIRMTFDTQKQLLTIDDETTKLTARIRIAVVAY